MAVSFERLTSRVNLYNSLLDDKDSIERLAKCYGQLSEAYFSGSGKGAIKSNASTYATLLNLNVVQFASWAYKNGLMAATEERYTKLGALLDPESQSFLGVIAGELGDVTPVKIVPTMSEVGNAINLFGIPEVAASDGLDFEPDELSADELADIQGIFDGGFGGEQPAAPVAEPQAIPDEDLSDDRLLKKYDSAWGGKLDRAMSKLFETFSELYSSGFSGIIAEPCGLLTSTGTIKAYSGKNIIARSKTSDVAMDKEIYTFIMKALSSSAENIKFSGFSKVGESGDNELMDDSIVDYSQIGDFNTKVLYNFHARFCFGYYASCKGLRKYVKEHSSKVPVNIDTATRVSRYSDLAGYMKSELKKIFYSAYESQNVGTDAVNQSTGDNELTTQINQELCCALHNIIVTTEQKKGVYREIKVSTGFGIDTERFVASLSNISGDTIEKIGDKNGVVTLRIVYDKDKMDNSSLFANEAISGILASGEPMSWGHALLGRKLDGTPLFWDKFVESSPSNRVYCIYGESRSGKGIMTTTILCNALSNGYKLIYIDGKPENGIGTGKLAWSKGREAAVFDGADQALEPYNKPLDYYTSGVRSDGEAFTSMGLLPPELFRHTRDAKKFVLLCTYLRGIEVTLKAIDYRAKQNKDPDDWLVAVFDELRYMASAENDIRQLFLDVLKERGLASDRQKELIYISRNEKNAKKFDANVEFICKWLMWLRDLKSIVHNGVTMSIGKSQTNLFFIFQGSGWFAEMGSTFIVKDLILKLDSTKIIGRQGVTGKGADSKYGDGNAARYSWVEYVNNHPGSWAITHTANVNQCQSESSVTLFKPFNVYLEPRVSSKLSPAEAEMKKQEEYSDPEKAGRYIGPYLNLLLGDESGMRAADILNSGFSYMDEFVRTEGIGTGLKQFMYNAHQFGGVVDNIKDELMSGHEFDAPDDEIDFGTNERREAPQESPNIQPPPIRVNGAAEGMSRDTAEMLRRAQEAAYAYEQPQGYSQPIPESGQRYTPPMQTGEFDDYDAGDGQPSYHAQPGEYERQPYGVPDGGFDLGRYNSTRTFMEQQGCTFITPTRTARVLKLTPDNSTIITAADLRPVSRSRKLLANFKGAQYEFQSRWKLILNAVAKEQNPDTITVVTLFSDALIFNKKQIAAIGLLGGDDGVMVRDIVDFGMLAKKFRNIRTLRIDTEVYESAYVQMNNNPPEMLLFNMFSRLQELVIWKPGYGEPPLTFTRQSINSEQAQRQMQIQSERARLKQGIDAIASANDSRFNRRSNVDKYRAFNGAKNLTGSGWSKCKQHFSNDHYIRGTVAGLFTVGAAAFTGLFYGLGRLTSRFGR